MTKKTSTIAEKKHANSSRSKKRRPPSKEVEAALASLRDLEPINAQAARVIALLEAWLQEENGYDETTWPELKKNLERDRSRTGSRRLLDG